MVSMVDNYETIAVRSTTKKRLSAIMKKTTTYDQAVNFLINEHIKAQNGGL